MTDFSTSYQLTPCWCMDIHNHLSPTNRPVTQLLIIQAKNKSWPGQLLTSGWKARSTKWNWLALPATLFGFTVASRLRQRLFSLLWSLVWGPPPDELSIPGQLSLGGYLQYISHCVSSLFPGGRGIHGVSQPPDIFMEFKAQVHLVLTFWISWLTGRAASSYMLWNL